MTGTPPCRRMSSTSDCDDFTSNTILIIDKNVRALTRIADTHYIIEKGRIVWTGSSPELAAHEEVQHRYLGV